MIVLRGARSPKWTRTSCAVVPLALIVCYFGVAAEVTLGAEGYRSFAAFNAKVEIDIEDGEVEVTATFALDAASDGIDPVKEPVTLEVTGGAGAFSLTLPAGSFKVDRSGGFLFQGAIKRVKLQASIRPLRDGSYQFEIETDGANLKGMANPVTVSLAIGDDRGSRTVRAKID